MSTRPNTGAKYSRKTERAIEKYGFGNCVWAARQCDHYGEGASTIAEGMGWTTKDGRTNTQAADAACDAGREIIEEQRAFDLERGA